MVHLELPFEVGDHPQALHHRLRIPAACEVDDELGEDVDLDVLDPRIAERRADELDALLDREHRLLVLRVANDADDDAVEDLGRTADHVEMAVRDRVVCAGADRGQWMQSLNGPPAATRPGPTPSEGASVPEPPSPSRGQARALPGLEQRHTRCAVATARPRLERRELRLDA